MKSLETYVSWASLIVITLFIFSLGKKQNNFQYDNSPVDIVQLAPLSIQTYEYFLEAGIKYDIPKHITLGILRKETGFRNPRDFNYNPHQVSSANALGPGQVLLSTGRYIARDLSISRDNLLYDIKLNAELSQKYIRYLKNRYGRWDLSLGYYNTGYPVVNDYALSIIRGT